MTVIWWQVWDSFFCTVNAWLAEEKDNAFPRLSIATLYLDPIFQAQLMSMYIPTSQYCMQYMYSHSSA